ncbi:hypothetical protein AYO40_03025 [Planctomycetaceae bacterium SCGC AG-212-D15]|nr:hypothetical protein AYO40_03025 [Planctomycetaceae bacterium SCGC AG-212-D15]
MRIIVAAACLWLVAGTAQAGPIFSMFVEPGDGSIHRSAGTLVGSNFGVARLAGDHTPLHNHRQVGLFDSVGPHGFLHGDAHFNFSTGSFLSEQKVGPVEVFQFARGGSFSVTGGANLDHHARFQAGDIAPGTTLLSGEFTSKVTLTYNTKTGLAILTGSTRDSLNPALAGYYGVNDPFRGFVELAFRIRPDGDDKGRKLPDRDDIHPLGGVIHFVQPVPEPSTLALTLGGLLASGVFVGLRGRTRAGRAIVQAAMSVKRDIHCIAEPEA